MGLVLIIHFLLANFLVLGTAVQKVAAASHSRTELRLAQTFTLEGVKGPADRTGISGRLDHMRYDPATKRLFIACVANGTLEAIDLVSGKRAGTVSGLLGPQGVAILGRYVYVTTGDDGKLHRFDARTLSPGGSTSVGEDADNVRVCRDGELWVSYGGQGPGGFVAVDGSTLVPGRKISAPRMPEGFQLHPSGNAVFANVPAGKRSTLDGTVIKLDLTTGATLWTRKLAGRAGNFPMAIDPEKGRVFVVSRGPARLITLGAADGSVQGEAECPLESDDVLFNAASGLVAVIGGGTPPTPGEPGGIGASLDLFTVDESGRPSRVGGISLPPHARTGALAADLRTIYVGVPANGGRPAEILEYRLPN